MGWQGHQVGSQDMAKVDRSAGVWMGRLATSSQQQNLPLLVLKVKSLSRVRLFATSWTVAHQAPPSMGFSRQEYWSGLPYSWHQRSAFKQTQWVCNLVTKWGYNKKMSTVFRGKHKKVKCVLWFFQIYCLISRAYYQPCFI